MSYSMKIWKKFIDKRKRSEIGIDIENSFFVLGKLTMEPLFCAKQLV